MIKVGLLGWGRQAERHAAEWQRRALVGKRVVRARRRRPPHARLPAHLPPDS